MNRRIAFRWLLANSGLLFTSTARAQTATPDLPALLRAGGCAVLLRHAQTEPGIGDPPNFRPDQCSTQRNLSAEGRSQAARIGQWFTAQGLRASSVQSSAWCRCKDTAELAFGRYSLLPALNSTFDSRASQAAQTESLRMRLKAIVPGQFEVWVTHQVNITSLTGEGPAMGEAFIVSRVGQLLARTTFR
jgi:phosphohistidine phosphatase SixA